MSLENLEAKIEQYFERFETHNDPKTYDVIITYDISNEYTARFKRSLLENRYTEIVTSENGEQKHLPSNTLHKKDTNIELAYNDIVDVIRDLNIDLKSERKHLRFFVTRCIPWKIYSE